MKTMKWLLRREFWEHKGSMYIAPLVVAGLMLATMVASLIFGKTVRLFNMKVNGQHVDGAAVIHGLPLDMQAKMAEIATSAYLFVSAPLFLMLAVVVFWYCMGALYDERRDRSILFWKSLPVSDEMSVLSKVLTAAVVSPVITGVIAVALSLVLLFAGCTVLTFHGVNLFSYVIASPNLYLAPLGLLSLLPVYVVWALPTIGWLMLVSSWARSKVFLWAVAAPLVALLIVRWLSYLIYGIEVEGGGPLFLVAKDIVAHGLTGVIPGIWFQYQTVSPEALMLPGKMGLSINGLVTQSWSTLASPDAWIGAAAGAAMLFGAIRIRRWRDEG